MASSKNSGSPDFPSADFRRMASSYKSPLVIAWSKIVGLDVSPVTESSRMMALFVSPVECGIVPTRRTGDERVGLRRAPTAALV